MPSSLFRLGNSVVIALANASLMCGFGLIILNERKINNNKKYVNIQFRLKNNYDDYTLYIEFLLWIENPIHGDLLLAGSTIGIYPSSQLTFF